MKAPLRSALLALALLLPACATATAPLPALQSPDPADAVPPGITHLNHATQPYVVAVLDKVTVRKADGSAATLQVTQEGTLPLNDDGTGVAARGLTLEGLRSAVSHAAKGNAVVWVEEFRPARVTVLGEVFHQIHTEIPDGPMRVLDAIAAANGFTSLANTRRVKLMRENAGTVDVYELDLRQALKGLRFDQNLLLKPGDVITVPKNFL